MHHAILPRLWVRGNRDIGERFLACGDYRLGAARIRCTSCSQKRTLLFANHLTNEVLLDLPHRQFVFTMPKALRPFFHHDRSVPTPRDPGFEPLHDGEEVTVDARKRAWARMLAKVYEIDPLVCPKCGGRDEDYRGHPGPRRDTRHTRSSRQDWPCAPAGQPQMTLNNCLVLDIVDRTIHTPHRR